MPRQIIDTESSRPAYVRRRIVTAIVVIVLVVAVALGCWWFVRERTAHTAWIPGNAPAQGNLGPVHDHPYRRGHAA